MLFIRICKSGLMLKSLSLCLQGYFLFGNPKISNCCNLFILFLVLPQLNIVVEDIEKFISKHFASVLIPLYERCLG